MYEALRLKFKDGKQAIKIKTLFMGTSYFAGIILETLMKENYNIIGVFTKPERTIHEHTPAKENVVKKIATETGIPLYQPEKLDAPTVEMIRNLKPDLIIVVNYGKMLPKELLMIPGFGCLNIHPSLLPKFRGPSPIQNALLAGEVETGSSVILLNEEMDAGEILGQKKIAIDPEDNYRSLSEKLANLSINLLLEVLPLWVERKIEAQPQDPEKATFCQLIEREDGRIMWEQEAEKIYNRYRALSPWPGIFTFWKNGNSVLRLKLNKISLQKSDPEIKRNPGEVFEIGEKIGIETLKGVIFPEEVQLEGKNPVSIVDFRNGYPNFIGSILQ